MNEKKRLLVVAGGTGGHIFPGLVLAHHLQTQGWEILWLGVSDRMEATLVPQHNIHIEFIQITGLRGKNIMALATVPWKGVKAICQSQKIIKQYRPNAVLCMGGYVSGPGGIAAWLSGIPIIIHEQNRIAGLANKCLRNVATRVLQAFPGTFSQATVVGNPIRNAILALPLPEERLINRDNIIHILVLGGSQGAHILNQVMPQVAGKINKKLHIWHQSGKERKIFTEALYNEKIKHSVCTKYTVTEFIDDISQAYAWADLVICRSGALTVSEIAAVGLPAIFVPFQHKDRQQYWNALPLEKAGAAKILPQHQFTVDRVTHLLEKWSRKELLFMAKKARSCAMMDATEKIAKVIFEVTK
ncbi:UDP-N-acetylglucosamine--N-acetylmuramyl-(pentapeptide) pyrophosphoryl-undecaprenol N-acetylglucosamine transferase [Candidatus Hartigia pinicola]|nr:UDP-N-acetylglucosamine--N-acetylmuramyl-(pentapeptide) pyrophosphoryl-undecaprenol N-acetylglucosamine transferase [Candidatus Hartigia pinicola]